MYLIMHGHDIAVFLDMYTEHVIYLTETWYPGSKPGHEMGSWEPQVDCVVDFHQDFFARYLV